MKSKIIHKTLRFMAKMVLARRKPMVVAITGSVGKTTTKEAVNKVLGSSFRVRSSAKNYNNEIGVPLAILGCQVNYRSSKIFQVLGVLFYWLKALLFDRQYPEILVLEMGADKPGDIKYFCDFVPITVGVLTDIGISHLENFKTKQILATEKGYLLRSVIEKGMAIYNWDNKIVQGIGKKLSVNTIGYGLNNGAEMRATDIVSKIEVSQKNQKIEGVNFKLNYQGKVLPVRLKCCAGKGIVYSALAALAVGRYFDLNLIKMIESLKNFKPCSGRMTLLKGINNSVVIDDSYNSAPASLELALDLVKETKAFRKILVLGDMLELGEDEIKSHGAVGKKVAQLKPDYFVIVGERMKEAAQVYSENLKKPENLMVFKDSAEAKELVRDLIQPGDLVLVKGSRGIEMDEIVDAIKA
ncbi:MAG: UDP-N-acetylmuramoyl-tripeptide--D-alanyl-D-alanine ligase [Candidatus Moranbacteria bacterium]|nr:UDP-N-acetylmuramoyl-tripeptide--D-alanyl-D-alanine ligase [Candidatus Moranbacteria bacterium]